MPLAAADQACKECRRRKAKCNRGIPTCGLCIKYNRHCLYEKHSKTPLTRKHLTEVEERLERAEALLRQARLVPPGPRPRAIPSAQYIQTPQPLGQNGFESTFDFSDLNHPLPNGSQNNSASLKDSLSDGLPQVTSPTTNHVTLPPFPDITSQGEHHLPLQVNEYDYNSAVATEESQGAPNPLECPPMDDFEWDEQYVTVVESTDQDLSSWASKSSETGDTEENVIDGMASLTVDEKEGGYLGVASGAALLRIIDPLPPARKKATSSRPRIDRFSSGSTAMVAPMYDQPNPNRHILDSMIDAYFRLYHLSYPIVHEPTFRAQYSEVIPRPNGDCWLILAYVIAAIGVFTTSTSLEGTDLPLFGQAKSMLSINFLEAGNLTLVQALTLISNYQQKRNKPNSGYNYLGLAVRMAMGLGLHKEFQGWNITPLKMEIRRRVWWSLCVFDVGATITFSRPMAWPGEGIEVAFPMNVNDRELTAASITYPPESNQITPYTAVRTQASFHMATNRIYARVISKPFPSAKELLQLDDTLIGDWLSNLPLYFTEHAFIPPKYSLAHAVMMWRYRNLRIIMYRPFVIRKALYARNGRDESAESFQAYERCLDEARNSIAAIRDYWSSNEHTRVAAWYALYFLFQAALIPCICLRNSPLSPQASDWRSQILATLSTISSLSPVNSSSPRCHQVILKLCGQFLQEELAHGSGIGPEGHGMEAGGGLSPINESPQTQMNNVYSMMWPNVPALEADVVMQDDAWMEFLRGEDPDFGEFTT
ncbi:fungal-specific transcription factor domain-containing protein [Halenospora varia]|nr:fungal-specific transcription factor domain-containing protein [Halenospora varia]